MTRKYQRYSKEFKGEISQNQGTELFIHGRDGRIPEKRVEVRYSPGLIGIRRVS